MADTESSVAIQDEETDATVSILTCEDDITLNWIVVLNADWSSIDAAEDE